MNQTLVWFAFLTYLFLSNRFLGNFQAENVLLLTFCQTFRLTFFFSHNDGVSNCMIGLGFRLPYTFLNIIQSESREIFIVEKEREKKRQKVSL